MAEELESKPEVASRQIVTEKIAIAVFLVLVLAVASLLYFKRENADNLSAVAPEISLEQLDNDYANRFQSIIGDYLSKANVSSTDLAIQTDAAQSRLLELKTGPKHKNLHLAAVLDLGAIAEAAKKGDTAGINAKLSDLRERLLELNN